MDATGLESRHISRHFLHRQGRLKQYRLWTKLTFLCDNASHLIAALGVRRGPSNDSPDLIPVVRQARERLAIDTLLGDGAYDAEGNHRVCHQELGIRRTVIPVNDRGFSEQVPGGRYRRQMSRKFPRRVFGQRWQVECVGSRIKRRLTSELSAHSEAGRYQDCHLLILTFNLMLLLCPLRIGFYRAL